ncbi:MAG TPA: methyltransferase domain-containing protein [Solirubrobacteraceae bacterium]|jgi:SAM-dependent methyltransferase|nr:methyltransferase domain-containing protein [Solirubrobacteraceae bacterium]
MQASRMRRFWDARAREDAFHFVDNREPYKDADPERFWRAGERDLDTILSTLGVTVRQDDVVLDLGCGLGRLTRVLARRAGHVVALDVSPEMLRRAQELNDALNNVTWLLGDGETLTGVEDASLDGAVSHVVFQHIPDAKVTLGYVEELARVLKPGAWAAFGLSTDPRVHQPPPAERGGTSRRDLLRGLAGRRPRGQSAPEWLGAPVPLDALGAVATSAGLTLEQIEGSGTQYTLVRAVRR